jgi:glycosyltransferase involved in cell wall biosynthesis
MRKTSSQRISLGDSTVAIVSHFYTTGPPLRLEEYLKNKAKELLVIGHPFHFTNDKRSFLRLYKKGKLVKESFFPWRGPEFSYPIKDSLLTLWWVTSYGKSIDYFIGCDNLNAFAGYLLQKKGNVKHYIFYTIDYIPKRFKNYILNFLYHFLDRHAVKNSLAVWNLSKLMVEEREKRGINIKYRKKQLEVPIGTTISSQVVPFSKIDRYKIVHLGHLLEKQGVEMLIESMKTVIKEIHKAHLLIIGSGPLEKKLRENVTKFGLSKHIAFTGYVEKFSDVKEYLKNAAIGVASYVDDNDSYTRFTDPGKPKDYISNGIAVIITKVPQVAYEIEKNKCGIAIEYSKKDLSQSLITLLSNKNLLMTYRKNAFKMAKQYKWDLIFDRAFKNTFSLLSV